MLLLLLWEVLDSKKFNQKIINAIKTLYHGSVGKVKIGNTISHGFSINKGLRQGCCLSPTLFKIYFQKAMEIWNRQCQNMGLRVGEYTVHTLLFADDQVVIADDYDDLEYMTCKLFEELDNWGLKINLDKTKYMAVGEKMKDLNLPELGKTIQGCEEFKYLGSKITLNGRQTKEMMERIAK